MYDFDLFIVAATSSLCLINLSAFHPADEGQALLHYELFKTALVSTIRLGYINRVRMARFWGVFFTKRRKLTGGRLVTLHVFILL